MKKEQSQQTPQPNEAPREGFFRRTFNARAWMDTERNVSTAQSIMRMVKALFVPHFDAANESFDNAVARLSLSEKKLQQKHTRLILLAIWMVVLAILIAIYGYYHLIHGQYRASLVSGVLMLISLMLAFRYHFWAFQVKQRKLGCTLREWFIYGLLGMKQ